MWINGTQWGAPAWTGTATGTMQPGWNQFQFRPSNNGGPGGGTAVPGLGVDWSGGTNWTAFTDPAPGLSTVFGIFASTAFNNALAVTSESTIQLATTGTATPFTFTGLTIGDQTLHLTGGQAGAGVAINGATTLTGSTGTTFDVQGANTLTLGGNMTASGGVSPVGIVKIGSGTLALGGAANLYSGGTTIGKADGTFGGTLAAAASGSLGSGGVLINNGILDIQTGYTETRQLTLAHVNSTIQVDAGTYTLGPALVVQGGAR